MELKLIIIVVVAITAAAGITFVDILPDLETVLEFFSLPTEGQ